MAVRGAPREDAPVATGCDGGHVLVNGSAAKPSTKVRAGDRVEAFIADRERIVEVIRPIESRVGADVAATCYVDHSPPVVPKAVPAITLVRGEGRPSKRQRRELSGCAGGQTAERRSSLPRQYGRAKSPSPWVRPAQRTRSRNGRGIRRAAQKLNIDPLDEIDRRGVGPRSQRPETGPRPARAGAWTAG